MRPRFSHRTLATLPALLTGALLLIAAPALAWAWFELPSPLVIEVDAGDTTNRWVLVHRDSQCGDGTITLSKLSGPAWVSISGWGQVTVSPPSFTSPGNYHVGIRATGTSPTCGSHVEDGLLIVDVQ